MKITIYELLGMIKDGKAPKKIKYNTDIYEYENCDYFGINRGYLFDRYDISEMLNDEVEILEEEHKIPEKICTNRIINTKDILEFEMIQNKINAEYTYAINKILDYLEEIK